MGNQIIDNHYFLCQHFDEAKNKQILMERTYGYTPLIFKFKSKKYIVINPKQIMEVDINGSKKM